jgi:hypothetical protein
MEYNSNILEAVSSFIIKDRCVDSLMFVDTHTQTPNVNPPFFGQFLFLFTTSVPDDLSRDSFRNISLRSVMWPRSTWFSQVLEDSTKMKGLLETEREERRGGAFLFINP